jgi:16S rRNA (guanine527-N7)-methyltransferase
LRRWGAAYNLTALRSPEAARIGHLADCLATIGPIDRWLAARTSAASPDAGVGRSGASGGGSIGVPRGGGSRVLDVGSGAGLPGLVIATMLPRVHVDCVDASAKKVAFIRAAIGELQLANARALHGRVETLVPGGYDLIVSRAFGYLGMLVDLTARLLAVDGAWMAMKGRRPDTEIAAVATRGCEVFHVEPIGVPGMDADRCLVWMRRSGSAGG